MRRALSFAGLLLVGCATTDPGQYLDKELAFMQVGVDLRSEESAVRRVLAQRQLRVTSRVTGPGFIALGASTRDEQHSAVRIITRRGVVIAEDAALDDLFAPAHVALIEHFGGVLGEYVLVATARVPRGRDVGCVSLQRILADGTAVMGELDVAAFGSRACVVNVAPAKDNRMRATIGWPALYALSTPQLQVELAFVEARLGEPPPRTPRARVAEAGDWLDRERIRLSSTSLALAPFSRRHTVGVARAALAHLAGLGAASQLAAYRKALAYVPPGSPESELVSDTVGHIERGWFDGEAAPSEAEPSSEDPNVAAGELVIEPPSN